VTKRRLLENVPDDFPEPCIEAMCPYLLETPDAFGTGDSPTQYECRAVFIDQCDLLEVVPE
jgi:hypothetical protein